MPPTELGGGDCSDGEDNDDDGDVDCADADCKGLLICAEVTAATCDDGLDNDEDGAIDCDDFDCAGVSSCEAPTEVTAADCQDDLDNDGDGNADCDDADCLGFVFCVAGSPETESDAIRCDDGEDNDNDGKTDCADDACAGFVFCGEASAVQCLDGIDNNDNGAADCGEPQCHMTLPVGSCRPARLAFLADSQTSGRDELFLANVDGSAGPWKLSGALASNTISTAKFAPDGAHIAFVARKHSTSSYSVYVVPSDGSRAPWRISREAVAGGNAHQSNFFWSPDSQRVLYRADELADSVFELFSAHVGGADVMKLSGTLQADGDVNSTGGRFSRDGTRVAFIADAETDGMNELYVVPSDAVSPRVKVSGALQALGDVSTSFDFSPDGALVSFVADKDLDGVRELYTAPVDGSAPPTKVSGPLITGGNVSSAAWSPDSSRLAFTADKDVDGQVELYVTPADASSAPIKVSGSVVADGDVQSGVAFTPDGANVIYRADSAVDGQIDLWITPRDGVVAPTSLSGTMIAGGNVASFLLSSSGERAVFVASAEDPSVNELYVVSLATPGQRTKLSGTLVAGGAVKAISGFSPDGGSVAFIADRMVDGTDELWVVSVGGGGVVPVSGALGSGSVDEATWVPGLAIRPYLPAGATCPENASCASLRCADGLCQF